MNPKRFQQTMSLYSLLFPCTFIISFLVVAPLGYIAMISLFKFSPSQLWLSVLTLENYRKLLLDPFYLKIIWTTVKIGILTTALCAVMGYPVAYFLARTRSKRLEFYVFLLIAPLMISSVIRIFGWIILLGKQGLVNRFFQWFPFVQEPIQILSTLPAVLIGLTGLLLPYMVMPLMSSIESIPRAVEEAAKTLGATSLQVFFKILIPLSLPGLASGSLLVYLVSISALVTPALMGVPKVRMLGNQVYDEVLVSFNWPFAGAISIIMIFFTFSVLVVYIHRLRRYSSKGKRS